MKILSILLVSLILGVAVNAQSQTAPKDSQKVETKTQAVPAEKKVPPPNEYVKMKDGKLWHAKDGAMTELKTEITLGETKVKPDGTVVMKDGTTSKLKENNVVNKNGNLIDVDAFKQKAMEQKATDQKKAPGTTEPK